MNKNEPLFEKRLRQLIPSVLPIEESESKSADFFAKDSNHSYLIEFKIRKGDEKFIRKVKKPGLVEQYTKKTATSTLYSILQDARKQLVSTKERYPVNFLIIWRRASELDSVFCFN